jgi:hypothetical protein
LRGARLSIEVGELDAEEGSPTVVVMDAEEGSTTVVVLDEV